MMAAPQRFASLPRSDEITYLGYGMAGGAVNLGYGQLTSSLVSGGVPGGILGTVDEQPLDLTRSASTTPALQRGSDIDGRVTSQPPGLMAHSGPSVDSPLDLSVKRRKHNDGYAVEGCRAPQQPQPSQQHQLLMLQQQQGKQASQAQRRGQQNMRIQQQQLLMYGGVGAATQQAYQQHQQRLGDDANYRQRIPTSVGQMNQIIPGGGSTPGGRRAQRAQLSGATTPRTMIAGSAFTMKSLRQQVGQGEGHMITVSVQGQGGQITVGQNPGEVPVIRRATTYNVPLATAVLSQASAAVGSASAVASSAGLTPGRSMGNAARGVINTVALNIPRQRQLQKQQQQPQRQAEYIPLDDAMMSQTDGRSRPLIQSSTVSGVPASHFTGGTVTERSPHRQLLTPTPVRPPSIAVNADANRFASGARPLQNDISTVVGSGVWNQPFRQQQLSGAVSLQSYGSWSGAVGCAPGMNAVSNTVGDGGYRLDVAERPAIIVGDFIDLTEGASANSSSSPSLSNESPSTGSGIIDEVHCNENHSGHSSAAPILNMSVPALSTSGNLSSASTNLSKTSVSNTGSNSDILPAVPGAPSELQQLLSNMPSVDLVQQHQQQRPPSIVFDRGVTSRHVPVANVQPIMKVSVGMSAVSTTCAEVSTSRISANNVRLDNTSSSAATSSKPNIVEETAGQLLISNSKTDLLKSASPSVMESSGRPQSRAPDGGAGKDDRGGAMPFKEGLNGPIPTTSVPSSAASTMVGGTVGGGAIGNVAATVGNVNSGTSGAGTGGGLKGGGSWPLLSSSHQMEFYKFIEKSSPTSSSSSSSSSSISLKKRGQRISTVTQVKAGALVQTSVMGGGQARPVDAKIVNASVASTVQGSHEGPAMSKNTFVNEERHEMDGVSKTDTALKSDAYRTPERQQDDRTESEVGLSEAANESAGGVIGVGTTRSNSATRRQLQMVSSDSSNQSVAATAAVTPAAEGDSKFTSDVLQKGSDIKGEGSRLTLTSTDCSNSVGGTKAIGSGGSGAGMAVVGSEVVGSGVVMMEAPQKKSSIQYIDDDEDTLSNEAVASMDITAVTSSENKPITSFGLGDIVKSQQQQQQHMEISEEGWYGSIGRVTRGQSRRHDTRAYNKNAAYEAELTREQQRNLLRRGGGVGGGAATAGQHLHLQPDTVAAAAGDEESDSTGQTQRDVLTSTPNNISTHLTKSTALTSHSTLMPLTSCLTITPITSCFKPNSPTISLSHSPPTMPTAAAAAAAVGMASAEFVTITPAVNINDTTLHSTNKAPAPATPVASKPAVAISDILPATPTTTAATAVRVKGPSHKRKRKFPQQQEQQEQQRQEEVEEKHIAGSSAIVLPPAVPGCSKLTPAVPSCSKQLAPAVPGCSKQLAPAIPGCSKQLPPAALVCPEQLLELQTSINTTIGETALHKATELGYEDMVGYYLTVGGVQANVQDNNGETPLHISASRGLIRITRLLLLHGAIPDIKSNDGTRPLHLAVSNNKLEIVRLLLSFGADINLMNSSRRSALRLARTRDMKLLINGYIYDITGGDDGQETPWEFPSSFHCRSWGSIEGGRGSGGGWCDLLSDPPPDDEAPAMDAIFDLSESATLLTTTLPIYNLCIDDCLGRRNYCKQSDLQSALSNISEAMPTELSDVSQATPTNASNVSQPMPTDHIPVLLCGTSGSQASTELSIDQKLTTTPDIKPQTSRLLFCLPMLHSEHSTGRGGGEGEWNEGGVGPLISEGVGSYYVELDSTMKQHLGVTTDIVRITDPSSPPVLPSMTQTAPTNRRKPCKHSSSSSRGKDRRRSGEGETGESGSKKCRKRKDAGVINSDADKLMVGLVREGMRGEGVNVKGEGVEGERVKIKTDRLEGEGVNVKREGEVLLGEVEGGKGIVIEGPVITARDSGRGKKRGGGRGRGGEGAGRGRGRRHYIVDIGCQKDSTTATTTTTSEGCGANNLPGPKEALGQACNNEGNQQANESMATVAEPNGSQARCNQSICQTSHSRTSEASDSEVPVTSNELHSSQSDDPLSTHVTDTHQSSASIKSSRKGQFTIASISQGLGGLESNQSMDVLANEISDRCIPFIGGPVVGAVSSISEGDAMVGAVCLMAERGSDKEEGSSSSSTPEHPLEDILGDPEDLLTTDPSLTDIPLTEPTANHLTRKTRGRPFGTRNINRSSSSTGTHTPTTSTTTAAAAATATTTTAETGDAELNTFSTSKSSDNFIEQRGGGKGRGSTRVEGRVRWHQCKVTSPCKVVLKQIDHRSPPRSTLSGGSTNRSPSSSHSTSALSSTSPSSGEKWRGVGEGSVTLTAVSTRGRRAGGSVSQIIEREEGVGVEVGEESGTVVAPARSDVILNIPRHVNRRDDLIGQTRGGAGDGGGAGIGACTGVETVLPVLEKQESSGGGGQTLGVGRGGEGERVGAEVCPLLVSDTEGVGGVRGGVGGEGGVTVEGGEEEDLEMPQLTLYA